MQDTSIQPTLLPTRDEIEKQLSAFHAEKDRVTKIFVTTSDNLKKYDEKLKSAKQEFSKAYHQKKVDRYREESLRILKLLTFLDNTIVRTNQQLAAVETAAAEAQKAQEQPVPTEDNKAE